MVIEKLTPAEAVEFAKTEHNFVVDVSTVRNWCKPPPEGLGIGIKIGGRLRVNKKRLIWILEGAEWKIAQEERRAEKSKK